MTRMMFGMTMGLGVMALAAQQLQAQPRNCAPREVVMKKLAEEFGETRRGIGLVQEGSVMEVFASDGSGSWTITVTLPSGVTCLVAAGEAYETLAEALPPAGDDA
ncbi:hypothetical protein SAMN05444007_11124 [Cribrihabitans marinus]|uniref:Uncharacterized protein n=2 Tax=Cribrihabitans marinus TaxID=1227549 RepID=A0A1H7DGL7_9RHOB|nr:hypothetical protein [Cribrihabitans marinus]GGH38685.1 hypothetical protein GCM10010973_34080 [Cribrihabitans marinus]SEK00037.1 hypothetical protein SAMN05444007_11124 [Cribrihabitans marinus]